MFSRLATLSDEFDDYCITPASQKGFYRNIRHLGSYTNLSSEDLGAWDLVSDCGHSCHEQAPELLAIGKRIVRWCAQCCGKIADTPPGSPIKKKVT